ncbi:P-aminobenzoate N-oxygenase AurF [cf. Phormidesmis sp. LEGE 11477]|uniref:P-aminobenzoate N-oxygenase AurF n=1 Tax=cf. Phormidesmis sp. LEGE 11477 TaxID=1828680 RepID=UPI0018803D52|nr:P-aminobenzoate N-oxygenase AurF [cf. Phormidesmis sp. LEGE 11477]MBE9063697.1 P-aminobenzoate N-oxygenase AurF [cf. Phormidesmis sp. LEGE 11477]
MITIATRPILDRKVQLNYRRNKQQDHTECLDTAAQNFRYEDCKNRYWQSEKFSLLYGTPLWDQATEDQRRILNHLYWVAYYSQIISAEIATIFFNQTSAAGLYAHEGFRSICDMLDLESSQERSHINAFQTVARQVEVTLFDKPLFSYPMRGPFVETMIFTDANRLQRWWKQLQLRAFGLLSAGNTFLACQYFTVRGLRTLNGKLVQHQLSQFCQGDIEAAPIPSQISHYHFMDESFHFNSSTLISQDVIHELPPPTALEKQVANLGIRGCQKDHGTFSVVINGIFWQDAALYKTVYRLLRSPLFTLAHTEAQQMMCLCFTEPSEGLHQSYQTHKEAVAAYQAYIDPLSYLWPSNRTMSTMSTASVERYLTHHKRALPNFFRANSLGLND